MQAATALRTASATSSGVTLSRLSQSKINSGGQNVVRRVRLVALSQPANGVNEVVGIKRLGQVGIDTDLVAALDVCLLCSRGQQHDAHARKRVIAADARRGLPAVE